MKVRLAAVAVVLAVAPVALPLAPPGHQRPALVGLLVVVELAQPVQQLEHGEVALGPLQAVVGL